MAWAQSRGIKSVEVRVDDGAWQQAKLGPDAGIDYWRQWYLPWDAPRRRGRRTLTVRATDATGTVQTPTEGRPVPPGRDRVALRRRHHRWSRDVAK